MDDRDDPLSRLGPATDGRPPNEGYARTHVWEWGREAGRRPGLPWIGIFLLVFGGILLLQEAFPQLESLGSVLVLAIGVAFLIKWTIDRGTGSLYAGAIITALAAPGLLNAAGIHSSGLGTISFGIALLFIAAVRATTGGGTGWQLWTGGLLVLVGGVSIGSATAAGPILLVALGAALLLRGLGRGIGPR